MEFRKVTLCVIVGRVASSSSDTHRPRENWYFSLGRPDPRVALVASQLLAATGVILSAVAFCVPE